MSAAPKLRYYDYDEMAAMTGYAPRTIKQFCNDHVIDYIIKRLPIRPAYIRYRMIPETEIVKLQIRKLTMLRTRQGGQWPTTGKP